MKSVLNTIIAGLIIGAISTGAYSVVKVHVNEANIINLIKKIDELAADVRIIRNVVVKP